MDKPLDIGAKEIVGLRRVNRKLRQRLTEIENIIHDNDVMLSMLHHIALLLLHRPQDWPQRAETLMRRGMKVSGCRLMVFSASDKTTAAQTARLPAGGKPAQTPLDPKAPKAAVYYHLPIKQGRQAVGLITFSTRQDKDFIRGDDEFCRRLAQLLAAAL